MSETQTQPNPERPTDPNRPPWLPPMDEWHSLPEQHRRRFDELLVPMYQSLVTKTGDVLEQTVGMSIVQLAWMELHNCHEAGKSSIGDLEISDVPALGPNRESYFKLHEKLTQRKLQAIDLLHKLRRHKEKNGADQNRVDTSLLDKPAVPPDCNGPDQTGDAQKRADQKARSQASLVSGVEAILTYLEENPLPADQNEAGHPQTADSGAENSDWFADLPPVLTKNGPENRHRDKLERQRTKALRRRAKKRRD